VRRRRDRPSRDFGSGADRERSRLGQDRGRQPKPSGRDLGSGADRVVLEAAGVS
jgi:hypothetical protein